ncbi:hypothetical protein [Streptomyces sp. NPDC127108]|uniref:hypothetical protein n=1 Tax=Streptomyces sp. NPDC127108 TaxID=3345361 RepID=UPI003643EC5F
MRRSVVLVAGALAAMTALATPAAAVTAAPATTPTAVNSAASPLPPLPVAESLVTEGVTIEGPLINNLGLPHIV